MLELTPSTPASRLSQLEQRRGDDDTRGGAAGTTAAAESEWQTALIAAECGRREERRGGGGGNGCLWWVGWGPGRRPLGVDHACGVPAELTTSAAPSWRGRTDAALGRTLSAAAAARSTCAFRGSAEATTAAVRKPALGAGHESDVGGTMCGA